MYFTWNEVTIAVPKKGRAREPAFRLLEDIGIRAAADNGRKMMVPTSRDGVRLLLVNSMDIPLVVGRGAADLGMAGDDAVAERGMAAYVVKLVRLDFGACRVALAAPPGLKKPGSIATALPQITKDYCQRKRIRAEILLLSGGLEIMPLLGMADAIVDQVETGTTLAENGLRILDVIMESRMSLIGNPCSMESKKPGMAPIALAVEGVLEAGKRMMLEFNVASEGIRDMVLRLLPALKSPNVSPMNGGGYTLLAAVPKQGIEDLEFKLKAAGATDIVEWPPTKIIP